MDFIQILTLAVVQGLTEFLPVSSSAHLILSSKLLGWVDQGVWFDLSVHAGSLCAVIVYFRKRVFALVQGWLLSFAGKGGIDGKLAWMLAVATLPAGIAGLMFESFFVEYGRSIVVIAVANLVFSLLLWGADACVSQRKSVEDMTMLQALGIGLLQAVALIPGTSRSGITMTGALLLGFRREAAAEFSFLLAIPIIAAASLFQSIRIIGDDAVPWGDFALGAGLSALAAYLCIAVFLRIIRQISMLPFVLYRIALALLLFTVYLHWS